MAIIAFLALSSNAQACCGVSAFQVLTYSDQSKSIMFSLMCCFFTMPWFEVVVFPSVLNIKHCRALHTTTQQPPLMATTMDTRPPTTTPQLGTPTPMDTPPIPLQPTTMATRAPTITPRPDILTPMVTPLTPHLPTIMATTMATIPMATLTRTTPTTRMERRSKLLQ